MTSINELISVPQFLHAHNPPLGTFHPWSCWDALVHVHGRAHSFPLIHTGGVMLAWCRVGVRQSAYCGNSSISLPSGVGSSRMKLVHLAHVVCIHTVECPSLSQEQWEEFGYDGGSVINLAHLSQCMKGHHSKLDIPLYTACPPINLWFFSLSLIWVHLHQDKISRLQWNCVDLSIIVLYCFCCHASTLDWSWASLHASLR